LELSQPPIGVITIKHKISKKILRNMIFFKFLWGGLYGDFCDIKSSIRNHMDDIDFFAIFLLSEHAATFGGRLADF